MIQFIKTNEKFQIFDGVRNSLAFIAPIAMFIDKQMETKKPLAKSSSQSYLFYFIFPAREIRIKHQKSMEKTVSVIVVSMQICV